MAIDFSFIDHDVLGDVADAIRFVEGSTAGIAPADYPQRIRALDKYIPDYDVLNFYMPNGGVINLKKIGSAAIVELEYWLDENGQWLIWQPDVDGNRSITLTAGQTMYVRNTSDTSTRFSTGESDCYRFYFSEVTEAHGNVNSLLCKQPDNAILTSWCYRSLFSTTPITTAPRVPSTQLASSCYYTMFYNCTQLEEAPELPATSLAPSCYRFTFQGCTSLVKAPYLPAKTLSVASYYSTFIGCTSLSEVKTEMTDISANLSTYRWLLNVASTGDFYCDPNLTIEIGDAGIPSGWTRHDLT